MPRCHICILILAIAFFSCNNNSLQGKKDSPQKTDSPSEKINQLQKQVAEKNKKGGPENIFQNAIIKNPGTQALDTSIIKHPAKISHSIKKESDTTLYYYQSPPKKISVMVTPWVNGKRKVIFYDPFGKRTYQCDDVRLSYSSVTRLKKFHPDGAAALIEIHDNPGAGIYWSDTDIIFSINNEPQWKTVYKKPVESIVDAIENKFYWNETSRQWVKQEIVHEQPVPVK